MEGREFKRNKRCNRVKVSVGASDCGKKSTCSERKRGGFSVRVIGVDNQ